MMKRILFMLTAVMAMAVSCKKDGLSVTGQWELTDVRLSTRSAVIGSETVHVYIDFVSGGTFSMYQKLGEGRYSSFTGTWVLSGDQLSGRYSDGTAWGSSYTVSVEDNTLTMTTSDGADTYVYTSCTIPASVYSE